MSRRTLLFIGGGVVILCLVCVGLVAVIAGSAFFLTRDVADTGSDFMKAVRAEDYEKAYDMCAPSLRDEIGSVEGLRGFFLEYNFQPTGWTFTSTSVENNAGFMSGTADLQNGAKVSLELDFVKIEGDWLVTRIYFREL
ncbi:MAG: hypothetical protein K8S97_08355 [Anaerolineae bacterium]|nr:hypothetical protein [Anaerolineae bacterium]